MCPTPANTREKLDMHYYFWMNLGQLGFGLLAWGVPIVSLLRRGGGLLSCAVSLFFCALSLCLVVCHLAHLAGIGDVSAILDTADAFRLCAVVLTVGTLALNTLVLALQARRGI